MEFFNILSAQIPLSFSEAIVMGTICLDVFKNFIFPKLEEEEIVALSGKMLHAAFHQLYVVNEKFPGWVAGKRQHYYIGSLIVDLNPVAFFWRVHKKCSLWSQSTSRHC
jgi:hypothetical protein